MDAFGRKEASGIRDRSAEYLITICYVGRCLVIRIPFRISQAVWLSPYVLFLIVVFGLNVLFQIISNCGFKLSATSGSVRGFWTWQVVGNLAGLASVIAVTVLLRFLPLSVVFPVTTGLTVIGIQVVAAWFLFNESISPAQWLGTLMVVIGIALIGGRR
jgi:multidrug transporter EmrE-like cation transporter